MPTIVLSPSIEVNEVIKLTPEVLEVQTEHNRETLKVEHPAGDGEDPISVRFISSKLRHGQVKTK